MNLSLERALNFLNESKIRATYEAIGQYMNIPTQSVGGELGRKRPFASWVVSKATGKPTGYSSRECDLDLEVNDKIIENGEELKFQMRRSGY